MTLHVQVVTIVHMKALLATDGSQQARETADLLFHLAPPETEVTLLSVAHLVELPSDEWAPGALAQLHETLRDEARRLLAREAQRLEELGHEVEVVTREGDPGDQIVQAASELKVDLIAVGSRGMSRFAEYLLGGVSLRVVKHSPCSVLLGRPRRRESDSGDSLRIVLAIDGSPASQAAARSVAHLARHHCFQVDCVQVLPEPRAWGVDLARHMTEIVRRDKQQATQSLRRINAMLQTAGAETTSHLLESNDPAEAIIDFTAAQAADLIVAGDKGMGAIDRFLLGSVSHKLAHHAPCPLLLIKGQGL